MEHLLGPENIEIMEADERRDHRQALLPAVAPGVVAGVELTHVVSSRRKRKSCKLADIPRRHPFELRGGRIPSSADISDIVTA